MLYCKIWCCAWRSSVEMQIIVYIISWSTTVKQTSTKAFSIYAYRSVISCEWIYVFQPLWENREKMIQRVLFFLKLCVFFLTYKESYLVKLAFGFSLISKVHTMYNEQIRYGPFKIKVKSIIINYNYIWFICHMRAIKHAKWEDSTYQIN